MRFASDRFDWMLNWYCPVEFAEKVDVLGSQVGKISDAFNHGVAVYFGG